MRINNKLGKMNLSLFGIMSLLLIVLMGTVGLSASAVLITPTNPLTTDNLTCYVNGDDTGYNFHWKGSGVIGGEITNVNPLLSRSTSVGDVTCEAWKPYDGSSILVGSYTVTIPNTVPLINPLLPDVDIMQNSGLSQDLMNIWDYVDDAESPDNELTYEIIGESNLGVVDCSIRNNDTGAWVDCETQQNQFGYSDITIRVTDNQGLFAEDIFRVNVIQLNNPPVIANLTDVTIEEDSGLNKMLIDLWNYAYDVEISVENLDYRILNESGLDIVDCSVYDNRYIECVTQTNMFGNSTVVVEVSDGSLTDTDDFVVTVTPINDAPVVSDTIPNVEMYEDMPDTADPLINLDNFVSDVDNTNDELTWTAYSDNGNVTAVINPDNTISYILTQDFYGHATITYEACDPDGLCDSSDSFITVLPVNDAPIVENIPDVNFDEDTTLTTLWSLYDYLTDIDNPDDEVTWSYSGDNYISVNINANGTVTFDSPQNWYGQENITFIATDIGLLSDSYNITVTVNAVNDAPVITPIVYLEFDEDSSTTLNLNMYADDVDNTDDELIWSVLSAVNIIINISSDNIATLSALANWNGEENVTLEVSDGSLTDQDTFLIKVLPVADAPTVNITSPNEGNTFVCGEPITFDGTYFDIDEMFEGDSVSFSWVSSEDGAIGTGTGFSLDNLTCDADHTITLIGTDSYGLTGNDEVTIHVNANQAPVVDITNPVNTNVMEYCPIDFTADAYDPDSPYGYVIPTSWNWQAFFANGTDSQLSNAQNFTYDSVLPIGNNFFTASVVDDQGTMGSDTIVINTTENEKLNLYMDVTGYTEVSPDYYEIPQTYYGVLVDLDGIILSGDGDDLIDCGCDVNDYAWIWKDNGVNIGDTEDITANLSVGMHEITLTAVDCYDDAAENIVSVDINVTNQAPNAEIDTPLMNEQFVDACETVDFTSTVFDNDGNIISVVWTWKGNLLSTQENFSIPANHFDSGNNTVTLTIADNDGAVNITNVDFEIIEHVASNVSITLPSNTGYYEDHLGNDVEFDAIVTPNDVCGSSDVNNYTWKWDDAFDGSVLSTDVNFITDALGLGEHPITVYATDAYGKFNTDNILVNITNTIPQVDSIVCYNGNDDTTTLMELEPIYCEGIASDPDGDLITTWIWNVVEDSSDAETLYDNESSTFNLPELLVNGTYTVTARVIDDIGAVSNVFNITIDVLNNAPEVTLTADPLSGTEPLNVSFTCDVVNGNPDYTFDFNFVTGNTTTSTTSLTANNIYYNNGTYNPVCTVIDEDGDVGNATVQIVVDDAIPVADFYYNPLNPQENETINFTDNSTSYDAIVSYEWNFDDGNTSTLENPSHVYTQNGIYLVTLTVTDSDGSQNSVTKDVSVGDTVPTAAIVGLYNSTENDAVQFTGFGTGYDEPLTYDWDFGDGNTASGQIVNNIYAQQGNYTVTLTVTDFDGDVATSTHDIEIFDTAPTAVAGDDQITEENVLVQFDGSNSTGYDQPLSYLWDFGDGNTATGDLVDHIYTQNGIYIVILNVTDADGTVDTDTLNVAVGDTIPLANFTFTPVNPDEGDSVSFSDLSVAYDLPLNYSWDFGDGATSDLQNPTHTYQTTAINAANETFTVTLNVTDADGSTNTISKDIVVNDLSPTAVMNVNNTAPEENEMILFNGSDSTTPLDNIISYSWNFGDGNTASDISVEHTYLSDGLYNATLTVTDIDGSQDTVSQFINVGNNAPSVTVTANQTSGTEPTSITYTCEAVGGDFPLTFNFDFGNGITNVATSDSATSVNFTTTYMDNGTYIGVCTVTDVDGDVGTGNSADVIIDDVDPIADAGSDQIVNSGELVQFDGSNSINGSSSDLISNYEWDFGDGSPVESGASLTDPTHTFTGTGGDTFTVTLTVYDEDSSDSDSLTITINTAPDVIINSPADGNNYCTNTITDISFDGTATDAEDGVLEGEWFYKIQGTSGDGTSFGLGDTTQLNMSVLTAGESYTISFVAVDTNGAKSVDNVNINVQDCDIALNEFLADGIDEANDEFIELYNRGTTSTDLTGFTIEDGTDLYNIPSQTMNIGNFLSLGRPETGITLNNGGDSITLRDNYGNIIFDYSYTSSIENISEGMLPDGSGIWMELAPTPGSSNRLTQCNNGIDDDLDSLIDLTDPGCSDQYDDEEIDNDVTAPVVTIINPLDGSTIASPFVFSASTDEDAVCEYSQISTFAYGTGNAFSSSDGFTHSITLSLVDGTYDYYVKCQDTSGNTNTDVDQAHTQFTVSSAVTDNPPIVTLQSPADGSTDNDGDITVQYTVSDDLTDPLTCNVYSDTSGSWAVDTTQSTSNGASNSFTYNGLSDGTYTWNVECNDGTNTVFSPLDFTFTVALSVSTNNPPTATINSPSDGSTYDESDSITFIGTGSDPEDGALSGASLTWSSDVDGVIGTGNTFSTGALSVNTHVIELEACDSEPLCSTDTITITINALGSADLSGTVSDGINNPLYDANIQIYDGATLIASDSTDNIGSYSIAGLIAKGYDIVVSKIGFVTQTITQTLSSGSNTLNVNLVEDNTISGRISGSVRDNLNNGIGNAKVIVRDSLTSNIVQIVYTDSNGDYIVTGLPETAAYDLEAEKTGYNFVTGPSGVGVTATETIANQNIFIQVI